MEAAPACRQEVFEAWRDTGMYCCAGLFSYLQEHEERMNRLKLGCDEATQRSRQQAKKANELFKNAAATISRSAEMVVVETPLCTCSFDVSFGPSSWLDNIESARHCTWLCTNMSLTSA